MFMNFADDAVAEHNLVATLFNLLMEANVNIIY